MSECQSSNTANEVWDPKLFVGLNAKQKKNLRKKLQRKRKKEKLNSSQIDSSIDLNVSQKADSDIQKAEIDELNIEIGGDDA